MPENTTAASDLASQYAAQVTGDLERNIKEQERIGADIAALQEQLVTLERDYAVLVSMQQALGVTSPPALPSSSPTVPAPRTKAAPNRAGKGTRAPKTAPAASAPATPKPKPGPKAGKSVAGKAAGKVSAKAAPTGPKTAAPTLVELVRAHLTQQGEPRSAAEISTALEQAHTDRPFKTTVVRNTLENLVAKGRAQRSKQGSSVFYTAPDVSEQTTGDGSGTTSEPASAVTESELRA